MITVSAQELKRALAQVKRTRKGRDPITLEYVPGVETFTLSSFNGSVEQFVQVHIEQSNQSSGFTGQVDPIVLARSFRARKGDTVRIDLLNGADVWTIKQGDVNVSVPNERGFMHAVTRPSALVRDLDPTGSFALNADTMHAIQNVICPAAATDDSRPVLAGVYVVSDGAIAAADGFRLATLDGVVTTRGLDNGLIIPATALSQLVPASLIDGSENVYATFYGVTREERVMTRSGSHYYGRHSRPPEYATREVTKNVIVMTSGNQRVWVNAIDGHFPDFRQIVPQTETLEHSYSVSHETAAKLIQVIGRKNLFEHTVTFDGREVRVRKIVERNWSKYEYVDVCTLNGVVSDGPAMSINAGYLVYASDAFDGSDGVTFRSYSPNAAQRADGSTSRGVYATVVVMPMVLDSK